MTHGFIELDPDIGRSSGPAQGERALMLAVLEDALRCLAGEVGPRRERPQLAAEARAWMSTDPPHAPFSFDTVCDALGFCAEGLRTRLLGHAPTLPTVASRAEEDAPAAGRPRRSVPSEGEIVSMIRAGHPLRVVAERFGISVSKASVLSSGLASRIKAERDEEIRRLRQTGWTYRALAARFALSRIRVMRICTRADGTELARRSAA